MKIVALEEHFTIPALNTAWQALSNDRRDLVLDFDPETPIQKKLQAFGQARIDDMDAMGVDIQVLSLTTPGVQVFEGQQAITLARASNDAAAAAVAANPDRLQAFANLPTPASAESCVAELKRCVQQLGFKGVFLNGRTLSRNVDHPDFLPIYEAAAALGVPIYIHPQIPQRSVRDAYYSGFDPYLDMLFSAAGFGWHAETGIQAIRLILSGLFDRLPDLQIILGHWGEVALHFTQRLDLMTKRGPQGRLDRDISEYFRNNFYVTPSGMFDPGSLERTIELIGIDRVMFAVDYPYIPMKRGEARQFFADASLSDTDKAKIANGNWQRLTGNL